MLNDAITFLVTNIGAFFIFNLLLRFLLQVVRAPFNHPIAQFVVKLTNFAVLPVRRFMPSVAGFDTSSIMIAWVVALVMHALMLVLDPRGLPIAWGSPVAMIALGGMAVIELIKLTLYLLFGALLVQAILSWVQPYNPLSPLLDKLTQPMLTPLRKLIPPMGGIDLSPLFAMLAIEMLQRFVLAEMMQILFRQTINFI